MYFTKHKEKYQWISYLNIEIEIIFFQKWFAIDSYMWILKIFDDGGENKNENGKTEEEEKNCICYLKINNLVSRFSLLQNILEVFTHSLIIFVAIISTFHFKAPTLQFSRNDKAKIATTKKKNKKRNKFQRRI